MHMSRKWVDMDIPISFKKGEAASHKRVEVVSSSILRRWRWHPPSLFVGGGCPLLLYMCFICIYIYMYIIYIYIYIYVYIVYNIFS